MTVSADDIKRMVDDAMAGMEKLSEEDRASNKAKFAEVLGDKDKAAEMLKEATDLIAAHDKDGDGKLNKEEFMAYAQAAWDQSASKGWKLPEPAPVSDWEFSFEAYCRAHGVTDGLTAEQIFVCAGQKQKAVKEAMGI